jgi:hypothetical protein
LIYGIPVDCPEAERAARQTMMRHDLAKELNCTPWEIDALPRKTVAAHYAIMVTRDKKSRSSRPKDG